MAALTQVIDCNEIDPSQGGQQLPLGKHIVTIVNSSIKPMDSGNGQRVTFNLQTQEGLTGYYGINLFSPDADVSDTAKNIARQKFSALGHVTGVFKISDSAQLHGKPFMVEMGPIVEKPENMEVKKVFDVNGNEPKRGAQAPQGPTPTQGQGFQPVAPTPIDMSQPPQPATQGWNQPPTPVPPAQPSVPAPIEQTAAPQPSSVMPAQPAWGPGATQG